MENSRIPPDDDESARKRLYEEFDALDDYYRIKCIRLLTSQECNMECLTEDVQQYERREPPTAETFAKLTAEQSAEFNVELAAEFSAELDAQLIPEFIVELTKEFIVEPFTKEVTTSELTKEFIVEPITEEVTTTEFIVEPITESTAQLDQRKSDSMIFENCEPPTTETFAKLTAEISAEFNVELAAEFSAKLNAQLIPEFIVELTKEFIVEPNTVEVTTSEFTKEFIVEPITEEVTTSEFTKEFIVEPTTEEVTTSEFTKEFIEEPITEEMTTTEFIVEPITESTPQLDQRKSDSTIFQRILDGVKETYSSVNAKAIQNSKTQRLMVEDIYEYYLEKFPELRQLKCYWRNSVRHSLSLKNGNFIKYEVKSKYGNAKQKRYEYGLKPEGSKIMKRNTGTKKVRRGKKENEAI